MSIIVYGPPGTGKTLHSTRLASYFRCTKIVEEHDCGAPLDLYDFAQISPRFVTESVLYLTDKDPPLALRDSRRVVSIAMALSCTLSHDMRDLQLFARVVSVAVDGMFGRFPRMQTANARQVLERLGTRWGLQTIDALALTESALQRVLGWQQHEDVRTWLSDRTFVRPAGRRAFEAAASPHPAYH